MNRLFVWLRNYRKRRSDFRNRQKKLRIKYRIQRMQTPEQISKQAWIEDGKAIRSYWDAVGDDIRKATKKYEDSL